MTKHITADQAAELREALAKVGKTLRPIETGDWVKWKPLDEPQLVCEANARVGLHWLGLVRKGGRSYVSDAQCDLLLDEKDVLDILEAEHYTYMSVWYDGTYYWSTAVGDRKSTRGAADTRIDAIFGCVLEVLGRKGLGVKTDG